MNVDLHTGWATNATQENLASTLYVLSDETQLWSSHDGCQITCAVQGGAETLRAPSQNCNVAIPFTSHITFIIVTPLPGVSESSPTLYFRIHAPRRQQWEAASDATFKYPIASSVTKYQKAGLPPCFGSAFWHQRLYIFSQHHLGTRRMSRKRDSMIDAEGGLKGVERQFDTTPTDTILTDTIYTYSRAILRKRAYELEQKHLRTASSTSLCRQTTGKKWTTPSSPSLSLRTSLLRGGRG